jgi:hypothetical protein
MSTAAKILALRGPSSFYIRRLLRYWFTVVPIVPRLPNGKPVPWKAADSMRALVANSLMALQGAHDRCDAVTGVEENLRGLLAEIDGALK